MDSDKQEPSDHTKDGGETSSPADVTGSAETEPGPEGETEVAACTAGKTDAPVHLEEELAEALREKEQFRTLLQRTQADFVNYRKRMQTERDGARMSATRALIMQLLAVMDGLEVALAGEATRSVDETWVEGVRGIKRNFEAILASEGVEMFESLGERFDPRLHEAVTKTETSDHEPDIIIKVIRSGYKIRGEVLRPALTEVAAAPA